MYKTAASPCIAEPIAQSAITKLHQYEAAIATQKPFQTPYDTQAPLPTIVVYNPSPNACRVVIEELKQAWGDTVTIIQAVPKGSPKNALADIALEIEDLPKNWSNPELVRAELELLGTSNPTVKAALQHPLPIGLYYAWGPPAESPAIAEHTARCGFKWIGASPQAIRQVDGKLVFKRKCEELGIPTSRFYEFRSLEHRDTTVSEADKITILAKELLDQILTGNWSPNGIFIKSAWGGGGRGTVPIPFKLGETPTLDYIKSVLLQVINGVGKDFTGLYIEESMVPLTKSDDDKTTHQLRQLETEITGYNRAKKTAVLAHDDRLVTFNKDFQKTNENGLSSDITRELLTPEIYDRCRESALRLATAIQYDNKGTVEFLIDKITLPDGTVTFVVSATELNCRRQVEARAIADLYTYRASLEAGKTPHTINVTAGQVMASCGYAPPTADDLVKDPEHNVCVHVRLTNSLPSTGSWKYNGGRVIGYNQAALPEWASVTLIDPGKIKTSKDPQIGCVLFKARDWEHACERQLELFSTLQITGDEGNLCEQLFAFQRQLAVNPQYRAGTLSCEKTTTVLSDPQQPLSPAGQAQRHLFTQANLWVNGLPNPNNTYPTPDEVSAIEALMTQLASTSLPTSFETPHSSYVTALRASTSPADSLKLRDAYNWAFREKITRQRGGMMSVAERDLFQQRLGSMSGPAITLLRSLEPLAAPVFERVEAGGAQYDVAARSGIDPIKVFRAQLSDKQGMESLSRSRWLHSLGSKSEAVQRFLLETIATEAREELALPPHSRIPVTFINFHAGNHPSQDITTRIMLECGFEVIPNFVFNNYTDKAGQPHGFTIEHAKLWMQRQINLFNSLGLSLPEIRLKNPGQGPGWTPENILAHLDAFAEVAQRNGIPIPIFHIHNHAADEHATAIAVDALHQCQAKDYLLIVDVAPPGTSHNSNVEVAAELNLTPTQRDSLIAYNAAFQTLLPAFQGYDNEAQRLQIMPSDTLWALGTTESDIRSAKASGVTPTAISYLEHTALAVFGCFGVVTPFSEILKSFALDFPKALGADPTSLEDIQQKVTPESVKRFIENGGTFAVDQAYILEFQKWETLVPRPPIVVTLLANHHLAEFPPVETVSSEFDKAKVTAEIRQKYPNLQITDQVIAIYVGWGASGEMYLEKANCYSDSTFVMQTRPLDFFVKTPDATHSGEIVSIEGHEFQVTERTDDPATATVTFKFKSMATGEIIEIPTLNKERAIEIGLIVPPVPANGPDEFGSPVQGLIVEWRVKPGDILVAGQPLLDMQVNKMLITQNVPPKLHGKVVDTFIKQMGEEAQTIGELVLKVRDVPTGTS